MKKAIAVLTAAIGLSIGGTAAALDCNSVNALINQGHAAEDVAAAANVPLSAIAGCRTRQQGAFRLNPAGPPPVNAAGPGPRNPAGPGPVNPAGPGPVNPAGIPK